MPRIELAGVSRRFPGGKAALEGVNLTVEDREFLAVVGPSGSGKSTLLRLIAGLEGADEGKLTIGGIDARRLAPRERDAALVFQNQPLFPHLNGRDNLAFSAAARGVDAAEIRARIAETARFLDLEDRLDRMPATLSGGEKQRVAVGRALVRRPSLLLLDEPFSNLDSPLRVFLRSRLADAHRRYGMTTVLITHDQEEALAMGDRVAVLEEGRIAQVGSAREVYDRPANRFVAGFLGNPPMATARVVIDRGEERTVLRFADDAALVMGATPGLPSGPVLIGVRSEHLQIESPGSSGLVMRVLSVEDRGAERIARLGRGDVEFWARLPLDGGPLIDEDVRVRLDLERASWFDTATGTRLA